MLAVFETPANLSLARLAINRGTWATEHSNLAVICPPQGGCDPLDASDTATWLMLMIMHVVVVMHVVVIMHVVVVMHVVVIMHVVERQLCGNLTAGTRYEC